ncbi:MAG TPA: SIMPL domain-containing protein [Noviherbaspirillum sp.]|jgi:predicted secreted protein|uniref:SIMPL domain-containing protein n=1 Tax=Noviherbaspirillum sp. TaxID=1926288 RepID=UPI002F93478C
MRHAAVLFCLLSSSLTVACAQTPVHAPAQAPVQTGGTMVVVPAYGEVKQANDEARVTFMVEEQDKDKAAAASRVNLKMKQGTEMLRQADPTAVLQTRGYYTYPVYAEEGVQPRQQGKTRQLVGWRVGQYLDMRTASLERLPANVAAVQRVLALNGLQFGLADATARKLEEQRIAAAWQNLTEKIAAISRAMGRNPADASLDTLDFEASGAYAPQGEAAMMKTMRAAPMDAGQVEEPSFEPGETTLGTRVVGKVRFK